MLHPLFLNGIIFGFSIAAVVGPVGIVCLQRSIAHGFILGMLSGLGAACADALFSALAAFGLNIISDVLLYLIKPLKALGGIYLLYLGVKTFFTRPAQTAEPEPGNRLMNAMRSTFLLKLTNPTTILSFLALFTSFNLTSLGYKNAGIVVCGTFTGSLLWWILLSIIGSFTAKKITPRTLIWINRTTGALICLFGLISLLMLKIQ